MPSEEELRALDESWELAERYMRSIGPLSSLFTAAIRAVRSIPTILHDTDPGRVKKFAIDAVSFPVKVSPTFKSAFYFAAEEIDEAKLAMNMPLTHERLLQLFNPDELTAVIALMYMYRTMKKKCDADEWSRLLPKITVGLELGHIVGGKIEGVGAGNGMLIGGLRFIAQTLFLRHDLKGFKDLRRKSESKGVLFDLQEEEARWGCNHLQVTSFLVSSLGFGIGPRLAFGVDTRPDVIGPLKQAQVEVQEEVNHWRSAIACIESLHGKGATPQFYEKSESSNAAELQRKALAIVAKGEGFQWITRSVQDLPDYIQQMLNIQATQKEEAKPEVEEKDSKDDLSSL